MTLADLLGDALLKKKNINPIKGIPSGIAAARNHGYNQALSDLSSLEIPEDRLREILISLANKFQPDAPQAVPCLHDWEWSNNAGRYTCSKCNHWSYLGK